jgi:hypothetical protein
MERQKRESSRPQKSNANAPDDPNSFSSFFFPVEKESFDLTRQSRRVPLVVFL